MNRVWVGLGFEFMNTPKPDGGPAFPRQHVVADANDETFKPGCPGMALRDYFAAKAMQGQLTLSPSETQEGQTIHRNADTLAEWSYQIADAMLKRRFE